MIPVVVVVASVVPLRYTLLSYYQAKSSPLLSLYFVRARDERILRY